jgi:dihydroorotate dehydrogenase subfamily 2
MKFFATLALTLAGFLISLYLYFPYVNDTSISFCLTGHDGGPTGCDVVRNSPYANILDVPMPIWGLLFYGGLFGYVLLRRLLPGPIGKFERELGFRPDFIGVVFGFGFSLYLTYLEAFVIHAWCFFCVLQAIVAALLFILYLLWSPRAWLWLYRYVVKPIAFRFDPEFVHNHMVSFGRLFGRWRVKRAVMAEIFRVDDRRIAVERFGRVFPSPLGLAAGFDYNGNLTQILPSLGFGFQSVGTVTNQPCDGNAPPRLGRLPKSRSLLVNKGFKNLGIREITAHHIVFPAQTAAGYQIALSIGATNAASVSNAQAQIADIVESFKLIKDDERYVWLELNISCPNVHGSGSLATPEALDQVLRAVTALDLKRPLVVKFPIELPWAETKPLVELLVKYQAAGIIIGNLAHDRANAAFDPAEIRAAGKGNFSGKPTEELSNQLIAHVYREFGDKLIIIGLGGVFTASDAYEKIRLGASLVQLITGMIYRGPAVIHDINTGLLELLEADGFDHLDAAIGSAHR